MSTEIDTVDTVGTVAAPPTAARPPVTLMEKGVAKLRQHAELKTMAMEYAEFICKTNACPDIYRGKPLDAAAAIIRGTALGFDPDGALEAFFVIKGKVGMYARAMIAVAENVGCKVWEEQASDGSVTWAGTRPGDAKVERVTWTLKRAELAGYLNNAKYRTNPQEMLRAKCQAELARMIAPGALMGIVAEVEREEVESTTARRVASRRVDRGTVPEMVAKNYGEPDHEEQPQGELTAEQQQLCDQLGVLIGSCPPGEREKVWMMLSDKTIPPAEQEKLRAYAKQQWAGEN